MTRPSSAPNTALRRARRLLGAPALGLALLLAMAGSQAVSAAEPDKGQTANARSVNFGKKLVSAGVAGFAAWVLDSADNKGMPFLIVDKVNAEVLMFDSAGEFKGGAPALLGLARGDASTPGIGERKLSTILPHERTTPAGRFVASLDTDLHGAEMLWIDYATSLSLHKVVKGTPQERRAERLNSPSSADNRVSFGCINVPAAFYDRFVSPAFKSTSGVVYILPETRTAQEVFGSYDVALRPVASAKGAATASQQ